MATTTTLTTLSSSKPDTKELCIICESQPYDLICTCGDKFDFNCIHQHVEQLGFEFHDQYEQVSEKLAQVNDLKEKERKDFDAARTLINDWKRKRIQDINDIADKAINDVQQQENTFADIPSIQETYDHLSAELHRVVHENLNKLIQLNRQLQDHIENCQNFSSLIHDDTGLDASLVSKINPQTLTTNEVNAIVAAVNPSSFSSSSSSSNTNHQNSTTIEFEPVTPLPEPRRTEIPRETEPTLDLTNSTKTDDVTNDGTNHDEFDAGKTRHIRRGNPTIIPVNNDKFAAAVCGHNDQLLYNDYDKTTQEFRLTFIRNIRNPTNKQTIVWNQPDTPINSNDDDWIQDIIYSDKLSSYLLLNRARLRSFKENNDELEEFHTFTDRNMKRLACSDKYIYLSSSHGSAPYSGDEIILLNYEKEEQLSKTFRDIIPSRLNRGAGPLVGEISDLAVGANEQVAIGYRLERRHEVGVCLFNVTNDGREWSCVKQLLLNECWHSDLSYTPRLDWSEKLKVFILIEYITGHLIMIDRDGQVEGECRFMQVENRQESPINLTIFTNDWFAVRYASSISMHKLTS